MQPKITLVFSFSEVLRKVYFVLRIFPSQNYYTSKLFNGRIFNILKEKPLKKTGVHYDTISLMDSHSSKSRQKGTLQKSSITIMERSSILNIYGFSPS